MSGHSNRYQHYLCSDQWKERRREFIADADWRCEVCGDERPDLTVHHLHYETLGSEEKHDVLVCCEPCHIKQDEKREVIQRAKWAEQRRSTARFEAWAKKVYGDEWKIRDSLDPGGIRREFHDFLDTRTQGE